MAEPEAAPPAWVGMLGGRWRVTYVLPSGPHPLDAAAAARLVGTTVSVALTDADASWTVGCDGEHWTLYDGRPDDASVTIPLTTETASLLFSRALTNAELTERVKPEGDPDLGAVIVAGMAAFFARG